MKDTGRHLDDEGEGELVRINILLGVPDAMEAAGETIKRWGEWKDYTVHRWNAYVDYLIALEDDRTIMAVLEHFTQRKEIEAPFKAKEYLITRNLERQIASKSNIKPNDVISAVEGFEDPTSPTASRSLAMAIRYLLSQVPGSLDTAMEVYHLAREKGVETDVSLARELTGPLCLTTPPRLEEAISIYTDYIGFTPTDTKGRDPTPIFSNLLHACAKIPSASSSKTVLRLLGDMRSRGLTFTPSTVAGLATILTRSSPDHETAFKIYAHLYALDSQALDRRTYEQILSGFIIHSTPASPVAPTNLYMEIIRDMQKAGLRIGSYSISSLLHTYGQQATRLNKNRNDEQNRQRQINSLLRSIGELHTMIKLDPLIEVDIPLLNTLMDAYNRVGAYAEAFEVWDDLVERRPRELSSNLIEYSPSINIILDTCGHSSSIFRGRKAWAWASRWKLNNNKKNYDAYVECLCRCGEVEEAYEVVRRMRNTAEIPDPTVETVMLLVKFSWKSRSEFAAAKEKVEHGFPELWDGVKEILETKRSQRPVEYR
jgi:pentatricopeptide repeat protein